MKLGVHLPVYGPAATRDTLLGVARRAEALGYDSLWVSDHVIVPYRIGSRYPYNATGDFPLPPTTDFVEPLTTLALVAGATERVLLGTSVLVLPHRHPVLAAKILATLDHLAPGRVVLGAGVGWMQEEIALFGVPYARRGAWSDEALRLMRACWTQDRVSFQGEFFRVEDVACFPRPARPIPVWIGGHTPRALRRVAELGDGWHAAFPTPQALADGLKELETACGKAGRDPRSLTLTMRMGLSAKRPAAELIAELRALRDLGVAHVIVETAARDLEQMTGALERFAGEVRAKL